MDPLTLALLGGSLAGPAFQGISAFGQSGKAKKAAQKARKEYRIAMQNALNANNALARRQNAGYRDLLQKSLMKIDNLGNVQKGDADQATQEAFARSNRGLVASGLYGTTARGAANKSIQREAARQKDQINENLTQLQLSALNNIESQRLNFAGQTQIPYPDANLLAQALSASGAAQQGIGSAVGGLSNNLIGFLGTNAGSGLFGGGQSSAQTYQPSMQTLPPAATPDTVDISVQNVGPVGPPAPLPYSKASVMADAPVAAAPQRRAGAPPQAKLTLDNFAPVASAAMGGAKKKKNKSNNFLSFGGYDFNQWSPFLSMLSGTGGLPGFSGRNTPFGSLLGNTGPLRNGITAGFAGQKKNNPFGIFGGFF